MNRPSPGINFNAKLTSAFEAEILAAREGFTYAKSLTERGIDCIPGVNCCPYGPAYPKDNKEGLPYSTQANAWYEGWWFWWYVIKPWSEVAKPKSQPKEPDPDWLSTLSQKAALWDALMSCERMRVIGSAKLGNPKLQHLSIELWSKYPNPGDDSASREDLLRFVKATETV